jgi:RNA polymerase sigma-70 factor (ECF subfamily)
VGLAIAIACSVLSEEQRYARTLRVVEGRPYNEVAEHLSCTEETARARVSRGLRRLARVLDVPQPETELGG